MRIVSQNRTLDLPYERLNLSISFNKTEIIAFDTSFQGEDGYWLLGHYPTEHRTRQVMEEIQDYYVALKKVDFMGASRFSFLLPIYKMPKE